MRKKAFAHCIVFVFSFCAATVNADNLYARSVGTTNGKRARYSPGINLLETKKLANGRKLPNSGFLKEVEETRFEAVESEVRRSMKHLGTFPITPECVKKHEISYGVGGKPLQKDTKCDSMYMGGRLSRQEKNVCMNLEALNAFKDMFIDSEARDPNKGQGFAIGQHGMVLQGSEYVTNAALNNGLHYDYRYDKRRAIFAFCKTQRPWLIGNHDWNAGDRKERGNPWPTNRDVKDLIKNSIIRRKLYEREGLGVGVTDIPLFIDSWDGTDMGHVVIKVTVHPDDGTIEVVQVDNKGAEKKYKQPSIIRTGGRDADFFDSSLASKLIPIMKKRVLMELQADRVFNELFGGNNDTPINSGLAVDESKENVVGQERGNDDSPVGVRGWCRCQKKNIDDGLAMVGPWSYGSFGRKKYDELGIECDLAYFICHRCGRVVHPDDRTIRNQELKIFDVRLYKAILEQHGDIVWRKAVVPLKKRQNQIASIPDGQIVIAGKCNCKEPDPIKTGFVDNDEYYICCVCGKVYLPVNGTVPTSPTAWREMMGPDKPFPGYKKGDKKK